MGATVHRTTVHISHSMRRFRPQVAPPLLTPVRIHIPPPPSTSPTPTPTHPHRHIHIATSTPAHPPLPAAMITQLLALLCCAATLAAAQRAIPTTDDNTAYFNTVQTVLTSGDFSTEGCTDNEQPDVIACLTACNAPGPVRRDDCCCATGTAGDNPDVNLAFFGKAGSCRYSQRLLNYSDSNLDLLEYASLPLTDGSPLYSGMNNCQPTTQGDGSDCKCSLKWSIKLSAVEDGVNSPIPNPDPTRTPPVFRSPSVLPSVSAVPTPSRTPTPTLSPTEFPPTPAPASATPLPDPSEGTPTPSQSSGFTSGRETNLVPSPSATPTDLGDSSGTVPTMTPSTPAVTSPTDLDNTESNGGGDGSVEPTLEPGGSDDSNDDDDDVCVDERYLASKGFLAHDLVHTTGRMAVVYCPQLEGLPCATKFHKVRLADGQSKSYHQLCSEGTLKCVMDKMSVNSVWTHKWEDVVHGDVSLTMYDVRYSERAQRALHRVMRSIRRMSV